METVQNNEISTAEDRDSILRKLENAIEIAHNKIIKGRVRDKNTEKVKQSWAKVLAQCANVYLAGIKDREIEALEKRIEALETKGVTSNE